MAGEEDPRMQNFIHSVALMASLMALVAGLWQDWEVLTTVKRMLISYLVFYFFGSFLSLAIRAIPFLEGQGERRDVIKPIDRSSDR
jgi:hypothetical protein